MVNPDGVICGNYRSSMVGCDLNRCYNKPDFRFHPTIWCVKNLTEDLNNLEAFAKNSKGVTLEDNVIAFVDMHAHSRKKCVFMYGPEVPLHKEQYFRMRIIPRLVAEETEMFRYHSCRFKHEKSKAKAARIVIHKELGITNCYTMESSFHSFFDHENVNHELTPAMYEEMGAALVNALYEYLLIVENDERRRQQKRIDT